MSAATLTTVHFPHLYRHPFLSLEGAGRLTQGELISLFCRVSY